MPIFLCRNPFGTRTVTLVVSVCTPRAMKRREDPMLHIISCEKSARQPYTARHYGMPVQSTTLCRADILGLPCPGTATPPHSRKFHLSIRLSVVTHRRNIFESCRRFYKASAQLPRACLHGRKSSGPPRVPIRTYQSYFDPDPSQI